MRFFAVFCIMPLWEGNDVKKSKPLNLRNGLFESYSIFDNFQKKFRIKVIRNKILWLKKQLMNKGEHRKDRPTRILKPERFYMCISLALMHESRNQ